MPIGKVTIFDVPGAPFEIGEFPTPDVEPGGLLIKNTHAVICGSDLHIWRGDMTTHSNRIVGHEFTGVVHSLGKGIETDSLRRPLKEGDRVVFPFFNPCNRCYWCIRGQHHACAHRSRRKDLDSYPYCDGGYADYYYLPTGHYTFKVPDELPSEAVPPVNCALSQVLFGLERAKMDFGDTVVVQGAGGLGIYATAVAAEKGASRVIVIDGQPPRLDLAMKCGATDTLSIAEYPTADSRVERVRELTHGVGADVVVEVVGIPSATLEGLDMVRANGKYIDIGNIGEGNISFPAVKVISNQTQWFGTTHYDPWILEAALQFLVRMQDRMPLADVISHTYPLEQINEAFEFAEWQGREGGTTANRVALTM